MIKNEKFDIKIEKENLGYIGDDIKTIQTEYSFESYNTKEFKEKVEEFESADNLIDALMVFEAPRVKYLLDYTEKDIGLSNAICRYNSYELARIRGQHQIYDAMMSHLNRFIRGKMSTFFSEITREELKEVISRNNFAKVYVRHIKGV